MDWEPLHDFPSRKRSRLSGHDYSGPGAYFFTICTADRARNLSTIRGGTIALTRRGKIVEAVWHGLPHHYLHAQLDTLLVMPDHLHGILTLTDAKSDNGTSRCGLGEIVRSLKAFSTRKIRQVCGLDGVHPVWQRGYYEHVLRNERQLARAREYIAANPIRWMDKHGPI